MILKEKIINDLKTAMKAGDTEKRDALRFLNSLIGNAEIEKNKRETGLNDDEVAEVIARAVKQRRDSVEQYEKGGRSDLAEKEKKEIGILSVYLPEQLSGEKLRLTIKNIIAETGSVSKGGFGNVMGQVMRRVKGQADGNEVKKIVEEELRNLG